MEHSEMLSLLKEYFGPLSNVRLVFLFGSVVRNMLGPESDIDVAVQFQRIPNTYELQNIKEDLTEKLHREIDLVTLNQASPILRMQVLKNGIPVLVKEAAEYCRFFTDTISQYDDLKRVRRPSENNILKGRIYAGP